MFPPDDSAASSAGTTTAPADTGGGNATAPASTPSAAAPSAASAAPSAAPATPPTGDQAPVSAPATDDLAPREGETAADYVARLTEAGVQIDRTANAQRKMHDATTEAANLRKQLSSIQATHGPAQPDGTPSALDQELATVDAEITRLWQAYRGEQDEEKAADAYQRYMDARDRRAELRVLKRLGDGALKAEAQERSVQAARAQWSAITDYVGKVAADVDIDLFRFFTRQAQTEAAQQGLTDPMAHLEWQINRAIELAREKQSTFTKGASTAATEAAARATTAGVVMAGGGAEPPKTPPAAEPAPATFVDAMRKGKARARA